MCCSGLQCVAVGSSVLQCVAVCSSVLQYVSPTSKPTRLEYESTHNFKSSDMQVYINVTLQHTATHCNTLQNIPASLPASTMQPQAISNLANALARAEMKHPRLLHTLGVAVELLKRHPTTQFAMYSDWRADF